MAIITGNRMALPQTKTENKNLQRLLRTLGRHRVAVTLIFFSVLPWLLPYHSVATNILIFGLYAVGFNL